ncbi:hypothetical protein PIB30_077037, partial [Stylosanthes scabra]|nr:hypothetical protein [Stylosanthes scabra]
MQGVDAFVAYVFNLEEFWVSGFSKCPCSKCRLLSWIGAEEMTLYLYRNGFNPGYWNWTSHGKVDVDNISRFETRAKWWGEKGSRRVNLNREDAEPNS